MCATALYDYQAGELPCGMGFSHFMGGKPP
jgi:hypothetical protein